MKPLYFEKAYVENKWHDRIEIHTDDTGVITHIRTDVQNFSGAPGGYLIPSFTNAHSHVFQFAMAGLAEHLPMDTAQGNFWTWREKMYSLALKLTPENIETIAETAYREMMRFGYTRVVEFHYVHHDRDGQPYDNKAEMSARLISAAKNVGIDLLLVPIFYTRSDYNTDALPEQRRFISQSTDDYLSLLESCREQCRYYDGASLGLGIHSPRAVTGDQIKEVLSDGPKDIPIHIHISEQVKDVESSLESIGQRPVSWMFENCEIDQRFNFVHATHLDDSELNQLATSQAQVVLCPATEANLGDGLFPLQSFIQKGGNFSIGSDSHINLNFLEELRLLDYGQRLVSRSRNTVCQTPDEEAGEVLLKTAWLGGARSFGKKGFGIALGQRFDGLVLDPHHPSLKGKSKLLSPLVYSADSSVIHHILVGGKVHDTRWRR